MESKEFDELASKSKEIVEFIISRHVEIDHKIGIVLAYCFCKKEKERIAQFETIVSPSLSFKNKIEILETILEHNYPSIKKQFPTIIKNLIKFNDWRNSVAHSSRIYRIQRNNDNQIKKKALILHQWKKNKLKEKELTEKEHKTIRFLGDRCAITLLDIMRIIYEEEFKEDYLGNPIKNQKS